MSTEKKFYDTFLELPIIYSVYQKIGLSLKSNLDIKNGDYQKVPFDNSLSVLKDLKIINCENNRYEKKIEVKNYAEFIVLFEQRLLKKYPDEYDKIKESIMHYDEEQDSFFIYRNNVPLKLMGFVMLLTELKKMEDRGEKLYILSDTLLESNRKRALSKKLLLKKLKIQDELGEIAEEFALNYEKEKLQEQGISGVPERVSNIDVMAGFDIVSYLYNSSKPNKFIEVKSCDIDYTFYISRNELRVAKEKGDSYYLYLYNRNNAEIKEIKNPYETIFKAENNWIFEPESYKVKIIR